VVKTTKVEKVRTLSNGVEINYVNIPSVNFYFSLQNASVEKSVDNVENCVFSTPFSTFAQRLPHLFPEFFQQKASGYVSLVSVLRKQKIPSPLSPFLPK
jgi:hypothetical protein